MEEWVDLHEEAGKEVKKNEQTLANWEIFAGAEIKKHSIQD